MGQTFSENLSFSLNILFYDRDTYYIFDTSENFQISNHFVFQDYICTLFCHIIYLNFVHFFTSHVRSFSLFPQLFYHFRFAINCNFSGIFLLPSPFTNQFLIYLLLFGNSQDTPNLYSALYKRFYSFTGELLLKMCNRVTGVDFTSK